MSRRARAPRASRAEAARLAGFLLASVLAAPAAAHLGHDVVRAERYLKIEVGEGGARFVVSLTLGPAEMRTILERADGDEDGTVTQSEADAYMALWGEGLATDLPVTIDGEAVPLRWGEAYFDPIGPVRPVGGTVEMVAKVDLDGGEHHIVLSDEMRVEVLERTDVRLTTEGPVELLAAGPGVEPEQTIEDFYFGNDSRAAPDALSLRVRVPGWTRWQRGLFVAFAALAVFFALFTWWRVRKTSASGSEQA